MNEAKAKGGHARAAALSPEQRHAIASKAATVRWSKTMEPKAAETRTRLMLDMSDAEAGKMMRYISQYKSGGFQNFMRKLIMRALARPDDATKV